MIIRCGIGKSSVASAAAGPANVVAAMPHDGGRQRAAERDVAQALHHVFSPQAVGAGSDSVGGGLGHGSGSGRCRTRCGHQNHLPSSAAMAGVMNDRTTRVSNSRPRPMVVPT